MLLDGFASALHKLDFDASLLNRLILNKGCVKLWPGQKEAEDPPES